MDDNYNPVNFITNELGSKWAEMFRRFDRVWPLFEQRDFSKHEAMSLIIKLEQAESMHDLAFANLSLLGIIDD